MGSAKVCDHLTEAVLKFMFNFRFSSETPASYAYKSAGRASGRIENGT